MDENYNKWLVIPFRYTCHLYPLEDAPGWDLLQKNKKTVNHSKESVEFILSINAGNCFLCPILVVVWGSLREGDCRRVKFFSRITDKDRTFRLHLPPPFF